ncbi:MAG: hypothetical protein FWF82_04340 [Oscillospiraceae bacterium]|nr:hypothetical protein [Oscillospiraceae bacterium]
MTIVQILDNVKDWCADNICSKVRLKIADDEVHDSGYEPKYVTPSAFVLYVPAQSDGLTEEIHTTPSLCVQLMEGKDELTGSTRRLQIRLCLSAWNPGEHVGDVYIPEKDSSQIGGNKYRKQDVDNADSSERYKRNGEGWRDVWNFTDAALACLNSVEILAGMKIVKDAGIAYGPFTEDGVICDYYPYFHSWITFTLECAVVQKPSQSYQNLL